MGTLARHDVEQRVIEAAKAFIAADTAFRVNDRSVKTCEKAKASSQVDKTDPKTWHIPSPCWFVTNVPDDTWCDACRHNWQQENNKQRLFNEVNGALVRLRGAVKRLEATHV